jgi:hypothetical protein
VKKCPTVGMTSTGAGDLYRTAPPEGIDIPGLRQTARPATTALAGLERTEQPVVRLARN